MNALFKFFGILWRLTGGLLGFAFFWSGGVILCTLLFPLVYLCSKRKETQHKRVRFIIRYAFKAHLWFLCTWGVMKIYKNHLEELYMQKGMILICNHPSLLDTIIIMSLFKNIQCIVKGTLWSHPILGGILRAAGYIPNDMDPTLFLNTCKGALEKGENILIFPEGTRTSAGGRINIKRGLSHLAIATGANIQALTLTCAPPTLTKGTKWYKSLTEKIVYNLKSGCLFKTIDYTSNGIRSLQSRSYTRDIQEYYNRHLDYENINN